MEKQKPINFFGDFLHRNLANCVSILGVVPLGLLFLDQGFIYILPLIIFNNIMDDLDGIVAKKLHIGSTFGANLDNVCDAVAHVIITLAIGAHFGGVVMFASFIAAGALILRVTSRVDPAAIPGIGSPTNELMRHLLFSLLLIQQFDLGPEYALVPVLLLHSVSMLAPFKMPALIRAMCKSTTAVLMVNVALVIAYLAPVTVTMLALAFMGTYLYAFVRGGVDLWHGEQKFG